MNITEILRQKEIVIKYLNDLDEANGVNPIRVQGFLIDIAYELNRDVPDEILINVALELLKENSASTIVGDGAISEIKEGDTTIKYNHSVKSSASASKTNFNEFDKILNRYRRLKTVGV